MDGSPPYNPPTDTTLSTYPPPPPPPVFARHQYAAENILQNYEVYIPPSSSSTTNPQTRDESERNSDEIWLVHIHGGAWRDPTIRAGDFLLPTLNHLLKSPSSPSPPSSSSSFPSNDSPNPVITTSKKIGGFVSLDYRLSPHISYPQDTDSTPKEKIRQARHPDHLCDILTALRLLQRRYAFGGRYVIVGHSCGGTLGWQVAMSRSWRGDGYPIPIGEEGEKEAEGRRGATERDVKEPALLDFEDVQPPMAIVSVCAIYDLPLLVQTHGDVLAYRQFTSAAFGEDERLWEGVSPARWAEYAKTWGEAGGDASAGRRKKPVVVLAHSRDDELVDWVQVEQMEMTLRQMQRRNGGGWSGDFQVLAIKGKHQEVWQKGEEMARAITVALDKLDRAESRNEYTNK
jgi:pimeloyl-ACP methyl ester carboxylesterase